MEQNEMDARHYNCLAEGWKNVKKQIFGLKTDCKLGCMRVSEIFTEILEFCVCAWVGGVECELS
jgi:hypothetical protein